MDSRELGEITGDWDYASLPANVEVGPGCFLERRASFERFRSVRRPGLRLGARVRVYAWTVFNVEPAGAVEVGAGSVLVGATIMCAERVTIGRDVVISYGVTIADSDFHPRDTAARREDAIANAPGGNRDRRPAVESAPVTIEDGAFVGIGAIILKGVRVGAGARVEAGAVVTAQVAAGARVSGNPARPVVETG